MKLMAEHLRESGVTEDQILEMNFEYMSIPEMDARGFYEYVKAHICPDKRAYLFFDEVQKAPGYPLVLRQPRCELPVGTAGDRVLSLCGADGYVKA